MNNWVFALARAARGPVLVLTLGILFAADQMQDISFRRTWPVLLVVYGVMKLIERLLAPPLPPPPPVTYYPPPAPPAPPVAGGYGS